MKLERSDVKYPLWRKKVDGSLFNHKGTTIPQWVVTMWQLDNDYSEISSRKDLMSNVDIYYKKRCYKGWVTVAIKGRTTPTYRVWFDDELNTILKEDYLMSYMRDIEAKLRKDSKLKVEEEISFWEFLDIEYDYSSKVFYFTSYYTQKPSFPELFKRLVKSPVIKSIDDELNNKNRLSIYKQDWKPRGEFESEIGAKNVIYTLLDINEKFIYVGEAEDLIKRFKQGHPVIKGWTHYKYNVLPKELSNHRITLERMVIRDFASIFDNNLISTPFGISEYKLCNIRIDKLI